MTQVALRQCKVREASDFADPELREALAELAAVAPEPEDCDSRRWEEAMALRSFRAFDVIRDGSVLLDIGAGPQLHGALDAGHETGRVTFQPNGLPALPYPEYAFTGVSATGWLDSFDSFAAARRGMEEICRVLRPGGVAVVSARFRLEGGPGGPPGALLFDAEELRALCKGLLWALTSPIDEGASPEGPGDSPIVERREGHAWTSAHLTLVKVWR